METVLAIFILGCLAVTVIGLMATAYMMFLWTRGERMKPWLHSLYDRADEINRQQRARGIYIPIEDDPYYQFLSELDYGKIRRQWWKPFSDFEPDFVKETSSEVSK